MLGAEPPPEEPKLAEPSEDTGLEPQATAEGEREVVVKGEATPARATPPSRPKRSPADWSRLATELGIETPPEPQKAAEMEPAQEEPVSFAEDLTPPFQELETPSEILSEARAEQAEPAEPLEPADASAEERRGRRHRNRRRRSRREESARAPEGAEIGETAEIASGRGPEEDSAGRRRPRHRRRRRGSDRRQGGEAEPRETFGKGLEPIGGETAAQRQLPEDADEEADLASVAAEDVDAAEGQEGKTGEPAAASDKASHRAIPSWGEAINYIVSANLEARAKNPDRRSSSRSRGNRNHGGREKPSDRAD